MKNRISSVIAFSMFFLSGLVLAQDHPQGHAETFGADVERRQKLHDASGFFKRSYFFGKSSDERYAGPWVEFIDHGLSYYNLSNPRLREEAEVTEILMDKNGNPVVLKIDPGGNEVVIEVLDFSDFFSIDHDDGVQLLY